MMDKIVCECQHAFMEGRHILDAVLVANEVVEYMLLRKRESVICKLDVEKTYDI